MGAKVQLQEADLVFAHSLAQVREALGLSLQRLSDRLATAGLNVGTPGLWKMEQGIRRVSVGEAKIIATALGVTLDRMLCPDPIKVSFVIT